MTAVLIGRFEPGSPEWHAARANGVGGSEVAPILGLSPFESRFSLWHRKAGAVGPVEETPEMEWGKRLEPVILAKFHEEHPDICLSSQSGTYHHPDRPWQIANPDGEIFAPVGDGNPLGPPVAIVEAKTARVDDGWGEPGTDQVPIYYRVQALWYCDVLDVERCWVPVLIGGSDYREYLVTYDPAEAAQIRAKVADFLGTLERAERPDIDGHDATYQTIKELHPDIDGMEVDLDDDVAVDFILAKTEAKAAAERAQQATAVLADAMGTAAKARWDTEVIARRQARGDGLPYVVAANGLDKHAALLTGTEAA